MALNKEIVNLLKRKKLKIAVAESCTGGMLSNSITSISGSSKVFIVGLVTYSNNSKIQILKVPKKIIKKNGAVSSQCCSSMVNNLGRISRAQLCVSITGIAGPTGGTKSKPVGLVYIGIKKKKLLKIFKFKIKNNGRNYVQKRTTIIALQIIKDIILT
jgi:nicotinamide-nucleotide amidase